MNFNEDIGLRLQKLRKSKGLSIRELSAELKICKGSIEQYELGITIPRVSTLQIYHKYFNVSYDYIIEGTEYNEQNEKINKLIVIIHQLSLKKLELALNILDNIKNF